MMLNTPILGFLRTIKLNLHRGAIIDEDTGKCKYIGVSCSRVIQDYIYFTCVLISHI